MYRLSDSIHNYVPTCFSNEYYILKVNTNFGSMIYCYNHKLNSMLVDFYKNVLKVNNFFEIDANLYKHVSGSALDIEFIEVQKEMALKHIFEIKKSLTDTLIDIELYNRMSDKQLNIDTLSVLIVSYIF